MLFKLNYCLNVSSFNKILYEIHKRVIKCHLINSFGINHINLLYCVIHLFKIPFHLYKKTIVSLISYQMVLCCSAYILYMCMYIETQFVRNHRGFTRSCQRNVSRRTKTSGPSDSHRVRDNQENGSLRLQNYLRSSNRRIKTSRQPLALGHQ